MCNETIRGDYGNSKGMWEKRKKNRALEKAIEGRVRGLR